MYSPEAQSYVTGVLDGSIAANTWLRLAIERAVADFTTYADGSVYKFDAAQATRAVRFIERLRTVEDGISTKAGDRITLLPWQRFFIETLYGWRNAADATRRFRRAFCLVARGNGKSTLASAITLYESFAVGIGGAESTAAASNKDQARIVLDGAREMLKADKKLRDALGVRVLANKVVQDSSKSKLYALPAKATSVEGLKSSLAVLDELHAVRGRQLYETLGAGCTKRLGSLYLIISTAGDEDGGVLFELVEFLRNVLNGAASDPTTLALIYGKDEATEWDTKEAQQQANPGYGITVSAAALDEALLRAKQLPGERANYRRKHLNDFYAPTSAADAFLLPEQIAKCYDERRPEVALAEYGSMASAGLDCASTQDLSSFVFVVAKIVGGKYHYYAVVQNWLPKRRIQEASVAPLVAAAARGEIVASGDSVSDFADIERYILALMQESKFKVREVCYDPAQTQYLATRLRKAVYDEKGERIVELGQYARNLTPGVKLLAELVADGRLHTNSHVLLWCLRNLRCKSVGMNWLQPVRHEKREFKIDAAAALIMALVFPALKPLEQGGVPRIFVL